MLVGNTYFVDTPEDESYIRLFGPTWDDAVERYCRQTGYNLVDHMDGPDHMMTCCSAQSDPDFLTESPVADECPF